MKKQQQLIDKPVSFTGAIYNFWSKYMDFYGTATRREYWYCWLFMLIWNLVCCIVGGIIGTVLGALLLIPRWSVSVRRFHDVGLSGWLYVVPAIIFLSWFALREVSWIRLSLFGIVPADAIWFALWLVLVISFNLVVFCMPGKSSKSDQCAKDK